MRIMGVVGSCFRIMGMLGAFGFALYHGAFGELTRAVFFAGISACIFVVHNLGSFAEFSAFGFSGKLKQKIGEIESDIERMERLVRTIAIALETVVFPGGFTLPIYQKALNAYDAITSVYQDFELDPELDEACKRLREVSFSMALTSLLGYSVRRYHVLSGDPDTSLYDVVRISGPITFGVVDKFLVDLVRGINALPLIDAAAKDELTNHARETVSLIKAGMEKNRPLSPELAFQNG